MLPPPSLAFAPPCGAMTVERVDAFVEEEQEEEEEEDADADFRC